jgi:hypothetical protein
VGSSPKSTPDERRQVFEFADEGESPRAIAERVYGAAGEVEPPAPARAAA